MSTALAPAAPAHSAISFREQFEPANVEAALAVATKLAKSNLLPEALRGKPEDVLIVMWKGRELGIPAMAALGDIHIVKGKPFISSNLLVAMCLASPVCEYVKPIERTLERCTYEAKRRGPGNGPIRITFTMDDAKRAGLIQQNQNYLKFPADMLQYRCAERICNTVFPDVTKGVGVRELIDDEVIEAVEAPASVAGFSAPVVASSAPAQSPAPVSLPATPVEDAEFTESPAAPEQSDREWCFGAIASVADVVSLDGLKAELGRRTASDADLKKEVLKAFGERRAALGGGK